MSNTHFYLTVEANPNTTCHTSWLSLCVVSDNTFTCTVRVHMHYMYTNLYKNTNMLIEKYLWAIHIFIWLLKPTFHASWLLLCVTFTCRWLKGFYTVWVHSMCVCGCMCDSVNRDLRVLVQELLQLLGLLTHVFWFLFGYCVALPGLQHTHTKKHQTNKKQQCESRKRWKGFFAPVFSCMLEWACIFSDKEFVL